MTGINMLKKSIYPSAFLLLLYILIVPIAAYTETFNVANGDELREALRIAESNGEDDEINLGSGIYRTAGSPFIYTTVEDFSLSITGQGPEITKLFPDEPSQVLVIKTPNQGIKSKGNITIRGVNIQDGATVNGRGGALFVGEFGMVTIENCEFRSNSAFSGGAVSVIRADGVYVSNNRFIGNNAQAVGGGAHLVGAIDITVVNNVFENNSTSGIEGAGIVGGGAIIEGNNVIVENNLFIGNLALKDGDGGGVEISSWGNLSLRNNVISENFAGSFGGGAGISARIAIIADNVFDDNTAGSVGGGFVIRADEVSMTRNIVSNNTTIANSATGGGGASVFIPSNLDVTNKASFVNNIFTANATGGYGGGLYIDIHTDSVVPGEILTITNNTLALNSTSNDGGGVHIYDTSNSENNYGIYNNIAYSNTADRNGNDMSIADGVFTNIGINLRLFNNDFADFYSTCENNPGCQSNIDRSNNISEDPLFMDSNAGDFALKPDSPCIDAGDPNAPDLPEDDIFGNPRGPIPDMGAVEYIAEAANNGGCSLTANPASSSLAVIPALPLLILIRRIVKRYKSRNEKDVSI